MLGRRQFLGFATAAAAQIHNASEAWAKSALGQAVQAAGMGALHYNPENGEVQPTAYEPGPKEFALQELRSKIYDRPVAIAATDFLHESEHFRSPSLAARKTWAREALIKSRKEEGIAQIALSLIETGKILP